jgi:hypothetical protein
MPFTTKARGAIINGCAVAAPANTWVAATGRYEPYVAYVYSDDDIYYGWFTQADLNLIQPREDRIEPIIEQDAWPPRGCDQCSL